MRRKQGHMANVLRLFCALSLLMVGFGHRPYATPVDVSTGADLSTFALPDGSLPYICSPIPSRNGDGAPVASYGCDACRIVTSVALVAPLLVPEPVGRLVSVEGPCPDRPLVTPAPVAHDAPPRAPPLARFA